MDVRLFVYGTLRDPGVQMALFGRTLDTFPAILDGFSLGRIELHDETVVRVSGTTLHVILSQGLPEDAVQGWTINLTQHELEIADAYEPEAYARIKVVLRGGEEAFAYVRAQESALRNDGPG